METINAKAEGIGVKEQTQGHLFELRQGEIVSIASVDVAAALQDLFHASSCTLGIDTGEISFASQLRRGDRRREKSASPGACGRFPRSRHADAIVEEWSLDENAALGLKRAVTAVRRMAGEANYSPSAFAPPLKSP